MTPARRRELLAMTDLGQRALRRLQTEQPADFFDPDQTRDDRGRWTAAGGAPTHDEIRQHAARVMSHPTPQHVAQLAQHLGKMTVSQLREFKRSEGIRAGGTKSAMAKKLAEQITKRVKDKERWDREARKNDLRPADLHQTARMFRETHNEVAREVQDVLKWARSSYRAFTGGGKLSRSMKALRDGDHTQVKYLDVIGRELAAAHPGVFPNTGQSHAERLYDLLKAGPPRRLSREESRKQSLDHLVSHREDQRRRGEGEYGEAPFHKPGR